MKIENDKYYTPIDLANYCIDKTVEVIGEDNITDILEPSCGNGSFFHHSKFVPKTGIDILPEIEPSGGGGYTIIQGDFLSLQIPYKPGRLIIGNPPYGERLNLAQKFYKKSTQIGDYISFILSINQLDNTQTFYDFDLVHSEDLGKREYSGRELHCCLNIYKRPEQGVNTKPVSDLKDVTFCRQDQRNYKDFACDFRICTWGNATTGKVLKEGEHYAAEYKIRINNDKLKDKILQVLNTYDWNGSLKAISAKRLYKHQIIEILKKEIPEIR